MFHPYATFAIQIQAVHEADHMHYHETITEMGGGGAPDITRVDHVFLCIKRVKLLYTNH